jgi:ABC-type multidrug transport system fused ATPase/permease subunit
LVLGDKKIRYRPNAPLVLKGITCTFVEGTRVGVVGRTGSGKTTLLSALFRLVEPENGKILMDGLDISTIELKNLRTKLSIIPQESASLFFLFFLTVGVQVSLRVPRIMLRGSEGNDHINLQ